MATTCQYDPVNVLRQIPYTDSSNLSASDIVPLYQIARRLLFSCAVVRGGDIAMSQLGLRLIDSEKKKGCSQTLLTDMFNRMTF